MPMPALFVLVALAAPPADDRQILQAAGINPDDLAAAVGYLRKRTLGADEQARLQAAITGLGAERFADREVAGKAVVAFGPAAAGLLRQAVQQNPDPEVQHRASECLRELDRVPHAKVAMAAVRAVVRAAPADAAGVLLGFLPAADDRAVAAEVRAGLEKLAGRDGSPDPVLVAALADPVAVRRAAAAVTLLRFPELLPKLVTTAVAEPDADTRFQILFGLATAARQKPAVAPLIELLPKLTRGRQWQVEDFLLQLAGADAPDVPLGRYAAATDPARAGWLKWWAGASDSFDLAAVKYTPRTTGGLLLVASTGAVDAVVVSELGPDLDERWRLPPMNRLADIRPLPDGRMHVGERLGGPAGFRVKVIDPLTHETVRTRSFPVKAPNQLDVSYTQAHPLPNDGVLLVGPGEVAEYAADKKEPVFAYTRPQKMDIASACRLPDGRTLVIVKGGPNHGLFLDAAGAEIPDKHLTVADPQFFQSMQSVAVGGGRVLVAEPGRLAEYDVASDKVVWQKVTADRGSGFRMTHGVQRLPNGNTLYVEGVGGVSRVVEVNRDGDEVWTFTPPGSQVSVFRAFQR